MTALRLKRAERRIDQIIKIIDSLVSEKPQKNPKALERMICDLHDIRRSMAKSDKAKATSRSRFWQMSKRDVRISIKIMNLLSKA